MRAKLLLTLIAVSLALAGCSGGLKRLAPPGILKYEDLSKGEPVNPAIAERIKAYEGEKAEGYPRLADQPDFLPEGIAKPEREALSASLIEQREALNAAVAADRNLAAAERAAALEDARDSLGEQVLNDDAAARAERRTPMQPVVEEAGDAIADDLADDIKE